MSAHWNYRVVHETEVLPGPDEDEIEDVFTIHEVALVDPERANDVLSILSLAVSNPERAKRLAVLAGLEGLINSAKVNEERKS